MEKRVKRVSRKPQSSGIQKWWRRLKSSPVAYHAVLIMLSLAGVIFLSSIMMNIITRHGTHRTVPDFMGAKIAQAQQMAKDAKLEIIINDSLFVPAYEGGVVLDQLPKGGVEVKAGRKVYVTINSFREKMVQVPYVAGRSLRQAKNMLEVAGLGIEKLVYEEDIATNYVLGEYVGTKQITDQSKVEIEMGSGVILKVGVQPENNTTIVPKAIGQSLQAAKSRLWEQGLNIGKVNFDDGINLLNQKNARVYRQSLAHNATANLGATVDLWLTLDDDVVEKSSAVSDKAARELEEERLQAEEAKRDSLEQAQAVEQAQALQVFEQSSNQAANVVETEEDEFFQ
jgi:beta-lactam-binding protein with PASTA domain